MSVIELTISQPNNNAIFEGLGSTITFQGSATTSSGATTTSGLYFKWFSTVAPWATDKDDAEINTSLQGTSALSFSTNTPGGGNWGMGTQWLSFTCKDTSGSDASDLTAVDTSGFDGGRNTLTIPNEWTINPRKIHILNASFIHPAHGSRYACQFGATQFLSPVEIYWEVRAVMAWISGGTRNEHSVTSWPGDSAIDDELVFEVHSGSIGTSGDAIFKSDVNASTFVCDLNSGHSSYEEYQKYCLWWNWTTGTGSKTIYLKVYQKDDTSTYVTDSTSFTVVDECPEPP